MKKENTNFKNLIKDSDPNLHNLYDRKRVKEYVIKFEPRDERKKISTMYDSMFKAMLFNHNRIKYSCKLLSYYLNISYETLLKTLKLGKNELDKKQSDEKAERSDYVAYIGDICINIEVNFNDSLEAIKRNQEYRNRLYSKEVKVGSEYQYTKVFQININNFAFAGKEKSKYLYFFRDEEGDIENDSIIVMHIFVPNIYKKWYNNGTETLTEDEKFLLAMVEPDIKKAKELGKEHKIMEEYIEESIIAGEEESLGEAYDKEWAYRDQGYRDGFEEGREEGREEGQAAGFRAGIQQKQNEIVKKLLKKGIDIETIKEVTGLSEQEVLANK